METNANKQKTFDMNQCTIISQIPNGWIAKKGIILFPDYFSNVQSPEPKSLRL